jgi:hypothetical protein
MTLRSQPDLRKMTDLELLERLDGLSGAGENTENVEADLEARVSDL